MIDIPTVLILGAGASMPYGLPSGKTLKDNIIYQCSGKEVLGLGRHKTLFSLLGDLDISVNDQKTFSDRLNKSMYSSVDSFLEAWPEFEVIGKMAIARNIIAAENLENLLIRYPLLNAKARPWYHELLNLMGRKEEFLENKLSIITFNYDRSFEYFLYTSLQNRFNLTQDEVVKYIMSIPVAHVYGQLGKPHFLDPDGRSYNDDIRPDIVRKFFNQIHLVRKGEFDTPGLVEARNLIKQAAKLIFIGFGYDSDNIKRLKLRQNLDDEGKFGRTKIYGTMFESPRGDEVRAKMVIDQESGKELRTEHVDAHGVIKDTDWLA